MAKRNPLQEIVDDIVADGRKLRETAKKSKVVKLGEERLPLSQARQRFADMTPDQRRAFIQKVGLEEALKLVK